MRSGIRSAAAALAFLTIVPLPARRAFDDTDLRRGVVLFPVVGGAIGAVVAAVAFVAALVLPTPAAAVLGIVAGVVTTGALHLDGLADLADGVGARLSGREPLVAMRDPRAGTFGVVALVLDLALKITALAALLVGGRFPAEAVAGGALARLAPLGLAAALPYSGPADGAGGWMSGVGRAAYLTTFAVGVAIAGVTAGSRSVAMVALGAVGTAVVGRWSARHLRGVTGDAYGAATELAETLSLAAAAAVK